MSPQVALHHLPCTHASTPFRMAYWQWGDAHAAHVLLCVHGLSRQGRDFDVLAQTLLRDASERGLPPLRIVCPDMPGRGQSQWLADPRAYQVPVYVAAVLQLMQHLNQQAPIARFDWLGTSMGGLIGMALAAVAATPAWPLQVPLSHLVLNDVGPAVSPVGLERIGQYIGQTGQYTTIEEAAQAMLKNATSFGAHTPEQWLALCRPMLHPHPQGGWRLHYDPAIGEVFRTSTPEMMAQAEEALWHAYDAISAQTLLLRGAQSDLLTPETARAMQQRGPRAQLVEVAGVGHAPTLVTQEQIRPVSAFLLGEA